MDEDLLGLYPSDNDDITMETLNHLFTEPNINRATSNTRGDSTRDDSKERRRRSKRDKSNKRESKRDDRRESSRRGAKNEEFIRFII